MQNNTNPTQTDTPTWLLVAQEEKQKADAAEEADRRERADAKARADALQLASRWEQFEAGLTAILGAEAAAAILSGKRGQSAGTPFVWTGVYCFRYVPPVTHSLVGGQKRLDYTFDVSRNSPDMPHGMTSYFTGQLRSVKIGTASRLAEAIDSIDRAYASILKEIPEWEALQEQRRLERIEEEKQDAERTARRERERDEYARAEAEKPAIALSWEDRAALDVLGGIIKKIEGGSELRSEELPIWGLARFIGNLDSSGY